MSKSNPFPGQEITYNSDDGAVVHSASLGGGGFRFPGGGGSTTPAPSLVVSGGSNLEFNLVWDCAGYFPVDNGAHNLGNFNDGTGGGDIAGWASHSSPYMAATAGLVSGDQDSYDRFSYPGINGDLSQSDALVNHALGFSLTALGAAVA